MLFATEPWYYVGTIVQGGRRAVEDRHVEKISSLTRLAKGLTSAHLANERPSRRHTARYWDLNVTLFPN